MLTEGGASCKRARSSEAAPPPAAPGRKCPTKPLMSKAACKPLAGYAEATVLAGGTRVTTVGLVSKTTDFTGRPMNAAFDLESKTGAVRDEWSREILLKTCASLQGRLDVSLMAMTKLPLQICPNKLLCITE